MEFGVKATRRVAPVRAIFYGRGGIGKSTIASQAPLPIFLASEEGLENIDTAAVEPYPKTWEEVMSALDFLGGLDHESIVVDSLDWLEPLCWDYVCRKAKKADIEAFGYGKGYVAALGEWRVFLHKLSALRAKGMNVILIAHALRKPFKNPIGDDYEHWTIKLHEKAAGLLVEWCDVVGYCDEDIATDDTSGRVKAQTTGKRVLLTNPHPAYLAKTRYEMPPKIILPKDGAWAAFSHAVRNGGPAQIEHLRGELETRIKTLADVDVESKVRAFIGENGATVTSLTEAIERLDVTINERKKAS